MHNLSKAQLWWLILSGHIEDRTMSFSITGDLALKDDYFIINAHQINSLDEMALNEDSRILIVFWDGLADYLAGREVIDDLLVRFNCDLVYVGSFKEELNGAKMYTENPALLRYNKDSFFRRFPCSRFYFFARFSLMVIKNLLTFPSAAFRYYLWKTKYFTFCGVITPSPSRLFEVSEILAIDLEVLSGYFSIVSDPKNVNLEVDLHSILKKFARLFIHLDINDPVRTLSTEILNLLYRTGCLSIFKRDKLSLITVDFYEGQSLNVYHSFLGCNNYHLDFGSKVGVGIYPRSADLIAFNKTYIDCRYDLGNLDDKERFIAHMINMKVKCGGLS